MRGSKRDTGSYFRARYNLKGVTMTESINVHNIYLTTEEYKEGLKAESGQALAWCPEHAFVIATFPPPIVTALTRFSCGCGCHKARVVTYEEAIEIVRGIRHARRGGVRTWSFRNWKLHLVRY